MPQEQILDLRTGAVRTATIDAARVADNRTSAQKAASIELRAEDFYIALAGETVLDRAAMTDDAEAWLCARIRASSLPSARKRLAVNYARKAVSFHRSGRHRLLLEQIVSVLPRADGASGGMTRAELDAMFLRARQ